MKTIIQPKPEYVEGVKKGIAAKAAFVKQLKEGKKPEEIHVEGFPLKGVVRVERGQ